MSDRAILLVAAIVMILGLFFLGAPARAHGEAHWIAENPGYKDEAGQHCCGIADCEPASAALFRETPAGVWARHGVGEVLMARSLVGRGLYPSIDDRWWWCRRHGAIKCIFKPTTGI